MTIISTANAQLHTAKSALNRIDGLENIVLGCFARREVQLLLPTDPVSLDTMLGI